MAPQRKIIKIEIDNRIVTYYDDIWKQGVKIFPKDMNLIERLRRSGKYNLKMMAALIIDANKGKNFEEYQKCKSDEEIASFVRKDCRSKGLMEVK